MLNIVHAAKAFGKMAEKNGIWKVVNGEKGIAFSALAGYTMYIRCLKGANSMRTTIVKWGNSQGIRLPKLLLDSVSLSDNDTVEVVAENNSLIIKKVKSKRVCKTIQERFAGFDEAYEPIEIDWGKPVGREIW